MQNDVFEVKKNNQEQREACVKTLFQPSGVLNELLMQLPEAYRDRFYDKFVKSIDVQATVNSFINEIKNQCSVQVLITNERIAASTANAVSQANEKSKLLTSAGTSMVDNNDITTIPSFQPTNVTNSPAPSQPLSTPPTSLTSASTPVFAPNTPVTQAPATSPPPLPNTPPPLSQVSPGGVPPANTPVAKPPNPNLEQSRTSFTVSANGKANIEFVGKIEGKSAIGKTVVIVAVTIPQELGLSYNVETSELTGVPLKAGEFNLNVHFQFDKYERNNPTLNGECNLFISPDPKTLWKDLPSDEKEEYWKKDTDLSSLSGKDGLEIIVASKRGRSHAHIGSCRDDDFCLMQDEESGWRVITVADGAGGSKLSRKGSLIASRTATDSVLKALTSERGNKLDEAIALRDTDPTSAQKLMHNELYYLFGNAAKEAVQAIDDEAKFKGVPYKDFSTTLIVTIHKKIAAGHFVAAYWVGDGGVGIYRKGQEVKVLGKADSGEFAGQTRFLDTAMLVPQEISNRIDAKIVPDFTSIIAMTDGITDPWFETDANIENITKWDELWTDLSSVFATNPPASGLLDWLDFWSQGNHDDRTIAVLYPLESAVQVTPEAVV